MIPDNLPEGKQRPQRTALYNDLAASLLLSFSLGGTPTSFLSGCASLPCFYLEQFLLLCAMSIIINFVPAFTVSISMINAFFTGGKDPGKIRF